MKLVVQEAPALKAAVDTISSLVEEGVFEIKKDGLHLKAMDPSQISMVSFTMLKSAFVEFNVDEERKIGVDINQLSNVLARGKRGEKAELTLEEGRLVVKFYADKRKRTFKIPLLEMGDSIQKEPKIEYQSFAKISADALKEAFKDAKLISSHVRFVLEPSALIIEVKGEAGDVRSEFESGGGEVSEIKAGANAKATFPLQYLEDIVKGSNAQSQITINLETDRPLKLEYEIEGARVVYYLAPRIETE
ncbi:MAG: proliferating cell nuclear antigen (pcna) [Candidatus Micrarchaeota archaeon]|nr:proliferating cell nuclear antigen (pcna) [Candidatus Micrarchaeota archaeon]